MSTTVSGVTEELYNKGGDSKFTDSDYNRLDTEQAQTRRHLL